MPEIKPEPMVDSKRAAPVKDGKKWMIAAIIFAILFCTAFATYLIVAGFNQRPAPQQMGNQRAN